MIGKILRKVFWWLLVRGWIPDALLRWKVRSGLSEMVETMDREDRDYQTRVQLEADFVKEISGQPIAVHQEAANDQHYEIPAEFYQICLGPKLKYSSCYFKVRLSTSGGWLEFLTSDILRTRRPPWPRPRRRCWTSTSPGPA